MSLWFNGSRKYVQRQKSLKKAFSWWEDEDENPDIAYKDFSRRKLLFDFGAHRNRRKSDVSICTFKMDQVGKCVINKVKTWHGAAGQQLPWRRAGGAAEPVIEEVEESKQDAERGLRSHQAPPQGEVNKLKSVEV